MRDEIEEKREQLREAISLKGIGLLMAKFGLFSIAAAGLTSAGGAVVGLIGSKSGRHTLSAQKGALLGAATAGIPLGIAWICLPCAAMAWVLFTLQRLESDGRALGTMQCIGSAALALTLCTMTMITGMLLAKPIADEPLIVGFIFGVVALGSLYLTVKLSSKLMALFANHKKQEQEPLLANARSMPS